MAVAQPGGEGQGGGTGGFLPSVEPVGIVNLPSSGAPEPRIDVAGEELLEIRRVLRRRARHADRRNGLNLGLGQGEAGTDPSQTRHFDGSFHSDLKRNRKGCRDAGLAKQEVTQTQRGSQQEARKGGAFGSHDESGPFHTKVSTPSLARVFTLPRET